MDLIGSQRSVSLVATAVCSDVRTFIVQRNAVSKPPEHSRIAFAAVTGDGSVHDLP